MANAYEWHNYGKTTIGNRTDIERVPVDNLRAFYRKYYRPDNVMVIVAGKFEQEAALDLSQKYFGALKNPATELPATYTEEPAQDGERQVILRRVGDVQVCGVGYHIPAASHEDYAACAVLSEILGVEPSGRLYKGLVENDVATSVSTMNIAGHDPGMLLSFCEVPKDGDLMKAQDAMIAEIEKIAESGVEDSEVKRIVLKAAKRYERQLANSEQFAISLSDWHAYGDWRLYFLHRDRMEKVTAKDVQRVAKKYCLQSNRTVGLFYPTEEPVRATIPNAPDVGKLLAGYVGREKMAKGESFEPTAENIDARTTTGTFESGVKYAMLPKKTNGETVTVSGVLEFGTLDSLNGQSQNCSFFGAMLNRGTKSLDFQAYRDRLDEIKSTIAVSGVPGQLQVNIATKREFLGDALDLLEDVLKNPAWNAQRFEELKRQNVTQLENSLSDPQAKAAIALQKKLAPFKKGDPRAVTSLQEDIEEIQALELEDVKAAYKRFVGGQNGRFAFVGDFDPEVAKTKMNKILNGWTTDEPFERVENPAITDVEGEMIKIETPDKANAVYFAGMHMPINDEHEDHAAMQIANYVLGGGPLSSRLADRVRKKEGLSYAVGSMVQSGSLDNKSVFMMFAISNPENSPKVVDTISEEVSRILESGVTNEELEKAKESFVETRKGGRANDRSLATTLLRNLQTGRTMAFHKAADEQIEVLTKEKVDSALKTWLDPERLIIVTAGDFAGQEEKNSDNSNNK